MTLDIDRELARRLLELVAPYHLERDPAHDLAHIERIVQRLDALSFGIEPPPRPHLTVLLACLHGVWRRVSEDPNLHNAIVQLLAELGWTDADVATGLEMLARHLSDPRTPEEQIVHDANYVELLGAFGIAKAFTTGGAAGQPYAQTIEIFEKRYLDQIVFRTPRGRALAARRIPYVKAFLRRLEQELADLVHADDGF